MKTHYTIIKEENWESWNEDDTEVNDDDNQDSESAPYRSESSINNESNDDQLRSEDSSS
jgi:hypothetical protein